MKYIRLILNHLLGSAILTQKMVPVIFWLYRMMLRYWFPMFIFYACTCEDVIQVEKVTPDAKLSRAATSSSMGSASDESVVQNLMGQLDAARSSHMLIDHFCSQLLDPQSPTRYLYIYIYIYIYISSLYKYQNRYMHI